MPSKYSLWLEMQFQPMYPLLEGVMVRWFGHSNKVLMNGRSKCLSGLVFPPSKECFQFRKQKEITWGKVWGIRGVRQNSYFFFLQKRRNYCGGMSWGIVMQKTDMFKTSGRASFLIILFQFLQYYVFVVLFRWCFCPFSVALLLRLLHQIRRLHTKPSLYSKNVWQLLGVCRV